MATIAEAMIVAVQYHQAGHLQQAEDIYKQILAVDPNHANALHLLGVLSHQRGQSDEGIRLIKQALTLCRTDPMFYSNLGTVLLESGQREEAIRYLEESLRLRPGYPEAHNNLGNAMREMGRMTEAVAHYREAVRLDPYLAEAHNNLGIVLDRQGQTVTGISHLREAIRLRPGYAEAHNNLGNALRSMNQTREAIACYREALRLRSDYAEAHNNLGNALRELGQFAEAVDHYREALRLRPEYAEAHNNLGSALKDLGRLEEAAAHYREAIRLNPDLPEVHNNLGIVLQEQGRVMEAKAAYRHALQLHPDSADIHSNLMFFLECDPELTAEELFAEYRRWESQQCKAVIPELSHGNDPSPERRLRIGYVSPDFRNHVAARNIGPVLAAHDHQQFEIFCYAQVLRPDSWTERFQKSADHWCSIVGWSHEQVAKRVREDKIDILVDLAGHIGSNRLLVFARKPAPVQVSYLFHNTTGLATMDYRITDAVIDPPDSPCPATEELVRLPCGWVCWAPAEHLPEITPVPARTLGRITFGSLNQLFKINPLVIELWSRVLHALPTARLLVARKALTGRTKNDLQAQFAKWGIHDDRLLLESEMPARGYAARYAQIDISLDTFPFGGGATTCECLWMGVPVITLYGNRPVSRMGASMLTQVGLPELIAKTPEEFVASAVQLAGDLDRLEKIRSQLRGWMRDTICHAESYTRSLEEAYRNMWRRWCDARSGKRRAES